MAYYPYQITDLETYRKVYAESVENPEKFWADIAENFVWRKKWDRVLNWNFNEPHIKWFETEINNMTTMTITQTEETT